MKWLYANPIVLNLVISIIFLLISFGVPLVIVLVTKALFEVSGTDLGFIGSFAFIFSVVTGLVWSTSAWRW